VKDLTERWMYHLDALERHRRSRLFNGRIAELQQGAKFRVTH
jgi:hypothetical protein